MLIKIRYFLLIVLSLICESVYGFRPITPNIDQIAEFEKIYITINETTQYHLNEYFLGFNLKYFFSANENSSCLPQTDIFQGLRSLHDWKTNLTSTNFIWSFYNGQSYLKYKILGIDKSNNEIYSTDLDIGTDSVSFLSFGKAADSFSKSKHFITMKNHSLFAVLCVDSNNSEFFNIFNLSENNDTQKKIAGPLYFPTHNNNSDNNNTNISGSYIKYLIGNNQSDYFLRFWKYQEANNNMSHIEIYRYDFQSNQFYFTKNITKDDFNLNTLAILDLKVKNKEVFFTEISEIIVRFTYDPINGIIFSKKSSEIIMSTIFVFTYGSFSKNLNIVLSSPLGYIIIVDWTDPNNPIMIERYSILPVYGNIIYLNCNEKYLMYYAALNNETTYFMVYERNKKLLNHLFIMMNFTFEQSPLFEFTPENNNLFIFVGNSIENYIFYDAILRINASQIPYFPKYNECNTTLTVISSDSYSDSYFEESFNITIQVLNPEDTKLYSVMENTKPHSYIDYPGQNQFSIDDFYVGPDIKYDILCLNCNEGVTLGQENALQSNGDNKLSDNNNTSFRINKINKLDMDFSFFLLDPSLIIFHNMQISPLNANMMIWFVQISNYTLYVYNCEINNSEQPPICHFKGYVSNLNTIIANMSLAYKENLLWFALKLDNNLFNIYFYDFDSLENLNITLPIGSDLSFQIFDFTILDFKIVLALAFNKSLLIIDLNNYIEVMYVIDASLMASHGFAFFSPLGVKSQYLHKNTLFILDMMSVIIVDISNIYEGEIIIIKSIISEATRKKSDSFYSICLSGNTLVIISEYPQIIEEYSISNYYLIYMRKRYPLYNYTIINQPESYDYNDFNGMLFIHAKDQNQNAVILIYNFVESAHNVLYSILPLNTNFPQIFIQTSGINNIYLSAVNNTNIIFYQIYKNATLLMNSLALAPSTFGNTGLLLFNVSISNSFNEDDIFKINYNITTWDSGLNITLRDPKSDLPSKIIFLKESNLKAEVCPYSLFNGSITTYSITCNSDCGKNSNTIHLKTPLSFEKNLLPKGQYNDLFFSSDKAFVQTSTDLLIYEISEQQDFNLIQTISFSNTTCKKTVYYEKENWIFTACRSDKENYVIFLADSISNPTITNASIPIMSIAKMMIYNDFLIILNAPENIGESTSFESSIMIYNFTNKQINLIDTIDSDDAELDHLYVSDFDVAESEYSDTIRFFIMDKFNGLRIIDFNISNVNQQIQYSLNLIPFIEKDGVDQTVLFSGVKVIEINESSANNSLVYSLLISTVNFHKYEILLRLNGIYRNNSDLQMKIVRCYLRYGFYSSVNQIFTLRNNSWFFIIPHLLPTDLMVNYNNFTKQILILFDRRDPPNSNRINNETHTNFNLETDYDYEYRRIFGGFPLNYSAFDYCGRVLTKTDNGTNETIFSLIYKNPINLTLDSLEISPNLRIIFDYPYSNDSFINLKASNDYHQINITLKINSNSDSNDGETKGWIIGLVIALLIVAVILIFVVKKYGKNEENENDLEEDLMENEEES